MVLGSLVLPRVCLANTSDLKGSAKTTEYLRNLISSPAPADLVVLRIILLSLASFLSGFIEE